jgi:hypothetical protein
VHRTSLLTYRDSKLIAISDYSNRHSIYFWNIACDWLRIDRLRASQQRGQQNAENKRTAATEDVSPINILLAGFGKHWA